MFKRKTRWDVQVNFPGYMAFGIKSHGDQEHTPDDFIAEVKAFVERAEAVNRAYKNRRQQRAASARLVGAVARPAARQHEPSTREK